MKIRMVETETFLELPPEWGLKVQKQDFGKKQWECTVWQGEHYKPSEQIVRHHVCRTEATILAIRAACVVQEALSQAELSC